MKAQNSTEQRAATPEVSKKVRNTAHTVSESNEEISETLNHIGPVTVCDVQPETLSDGSKVWNVGFQRVIVGCRSEKEAIYLASGIKDLIANCSIWVTA